MSSEARGQGPGRHQRHQSLIKKQPTSWWLDDDSRAIQNVRVVVEAGAEATADTNAAATPVTLRSVSRTNSAAPTRVVRPTHDLWANELLNFLLPTTWIAHWIKFLFVLTALLLGCTLSLIDNDFSIVLTMTTSSSSTAVTRHGEYLLSLFLSSILAVPWWMYVMWMVLWTYWYYHQTLYASPLVSALDPQKHQCPWMDPKVYEANRLPMHVSSIRYFDSVHKARLAACCPDLACRRGSRRHRHPHRPRNDSDGRRRSKKSSSRTISRRRLQRLSRLDTERTSNRTVIATTASGTDTFDTTGEDQSFDSTSSSVSIKADDDNDDDTRSYDTDDSTDDGNENYCSDDEIDKQHNDNRDTNLELGGNNINTNDVVDDDVQLGQQPVTSKVINLSHHQHHRDPNNFAPLSKLRRQAVGLTPNVWLLDHLEWSFQLMPTVEQGLALVYEDSIISTTTSGSRIDGLMNIDVDVNIDVDSDNTPAQNNVGPQEPTASKWKPIEVPGNWMLQKAGIDAGDIPIYTNQKYPFPCRPPVVPALNPTGVYKLELPYWPTEWSVRNSGGFDDSFDGQDDDVDDDNDEYYLLLHGAESACFVYWNGSMVGYFQDSRLPSEFKIPSSNLLLPQRPSSTGPVAVIHIVVARWSDGSYLEDQDDWWMAGLHRSVELIRRPKRAAIMDYHILSELVDCSDGVLKVSVVVKMPPKTTIQSKIRLRVFDDNQLNVDGDCQLNDEIWKRAQSVDPAQAAAGGNSSEHIILNFVDTIQDVHAWTAETPNLYTLTIEYLETSPEDENILVQCESCRIGFRTVTIDTDQGGILKVNGTAITVCGINRHEHDPDHGKVASLERMKQDIITLKRNNFNAVRTSHYPTHSSFYRLCDYYGLYVCDEANIETHGLKPMGRLANDSGWEGAFVSRVYRMVERDWNHPCIILWSLGNEAGRGRNLMKARQQLLKLDTSRPICYESGGSWAEGIGRTELTDIVCPMYTSVPRLRELGQQKDDIRPIVLCEYSHSMNNSNGNLALYWDAFWDTNLPRVQGGFIWDMIDQGLRRKSRSGREYFAYGGDFGDVINDRQFCINGMFSPEREPHPSAFEIKYLQQPVTVILEHSNMHLALKVSDDEDKQAILLDKNSNNETKLRVHSRYNFIGMDHLAWRWAVVASSSDQHLFDGFAVSEKSKLQLLFSKLAVMNESRLCEGAECYLNIEGILKDHTSWAPSGHVICREQYPIHILLKHTKESSDYHSSVLSIDNLKTKESAESIEIRSNDNSFDLTISKITGCIRLLKYNSRPVIGGNGLKTSYTRATTDNDRGGMELVLEHMMIPWLQNLYFFVHGTQDFSHYMHWKHYGLTQENPPNNVCTNTIVDKSDKARVVVTCNGEVVSTNGTVIMTQSISYVISPDGTIRLDVDMKPTGRLRSIPSLPRVGLSMEVAQDLEQIQYFGRGPHENYPDRKSSAQYGVWSTTPSEMGYNYIVPSENGSRSDCRWVSFRTRRCDAGLLVVAEGKDSFGCSALHHTAMEQEHATHTHNLDVRQDGHHPIHVNIDHQLMGVGGDVSWFPCVYPQFLVKPRPYKYSISLVPLHPHDDPAIKAITTRSSNA